MWQTAPRHKTNTNTNTHPIAPSSPGRSLRANHALLTATHTLALEQARNTETLLHSATTVLRAYTTLVLRAHMLRTPHLEVLDAYISTQILRAHLSQELTESQLEGEKLLATVANFQLQQVLRAHPKPDASCSP